MKIFRLLVSNLFEQSHYQLKLIIRYHDRLLDFRLLALRLGTPRQTRSRGGSRSQECTLRARSFTPRLLVALFKPLLVPLVHVISEAIAERTRDGLLDSFG
jgi:hypothetical protein